MFWLKVKLWNWLFADFSRQQDEHMKKYFNAGREQQESYRQEFSAFMTETRDTYKEDYLYKKQERIDKNKRHEELIAAIKGLK